MTIHWQQQSNQQSCDSLASKLPALDLSQGDVQKLQGRAFGDQLIPARRKPPSRMASQTRSNPMMLKTLRAPWSKSDDGAGAVNSSHWDAWLLLAANAQDPVQAFAYRPRSITGPELRLVAAQEGPPGQTVSAFVGECAIFRAPDGSLSAVPILACSFGLQVRHPVQVTIQHHASCIAARLKTK